MESCIVVGAGLSGLVAARALQDAGVRAAVLEKEEKVSGRMRTDLVADGVFDHGAQFFTVRSARFEEMVESWISAGVAEEWTRGFANSSGEYQEDGHPPQGHARHDRHRRAPGPRRGRADGRGGERATSRRAGLGGRGWRLRPRR